MLNGGEIIVQFTNVTLTPTAVVDVGLTIFIAKYELINRLRIRVKFIDERFAQIVPKRSLRRIRLGNTSTAGVIDVVVRVPKASSGALHVIGREK